MYKTGIYFTQPIRPTMCPGQATALFLENMGEQRLTQIPFNLENEGSGLCMEGYEGWDMVRQLLQVGRSPKK